MLHRTLRVRTLSLAFLFAIAGPLLAAGAPGAPGRPGAPGAPGAPASGGAQPGPETFVGTLPEAYERGRVRNAPVVLCMMLDDQADDTEQLRDALLTDKRVAEHARHAVLVLASPETHELETVRVEQDGEEVEVQRCPRFLSRTCEEHQRPWGALYAEFQQEGGELLLPQVVVKSPAGDVHERFNTRRAPDLKKLLDAIDSVRRASGPDISWTDLQRVRHLQREAAKYEASKRHGRALRSWSEIAALTEVPAYRDEADLEAAEALQAMEAQLAAAVEACGDVEDVLPGYESLLRMVPDFEDTPLERPLEKAIKAVERDKRHKAKIAAYKREREAEALLREAEDALAAGDEKQAEKIVRKLNRKYGDTEAALTARFKYPDWAK